MGVEQVYSPWPELALVTPPLFTFPSLFPYVLMAEALVRGRVTYRLFGIT